MIRCKKAGNAGNIGVGDSIKQSASFAKRWLKSKYTGFFISLQK